MKKLILLIALVISSFANLNESIQNIMGSRDYNTHRNLINHIFSNKSSFYTNGQVNYSKVLDKLSKNGLIKLNLGSTQNIEVVFNFNSNPKKSIKNITDILRFIGHQNFITHGEVVVNNQLRWTIRLKTAAAINPLRLSQELQSINCSILDIKREGKYKWSYFIDSRNSTIYKAEDLINNNQLSLKKSYKPYMVQVSDLLDITIRPNIGSNWYPSIIFYDNDFKIIEVIEKDSLHKSLKLDVPNNTKYIKIDDFYSLTNLKRGLTITKE